MVPSATPVTRPVDATTVATVGVPLIHVPPGIDPVSVIVDVAHSADGPVMGVGRGFTVTVVDLLQPVATMYVIATVPADKPQTVPVASTVAMPPTDGLQVPPPVASPSSEVDPAHRLSVPVMAAGSGFTVMVTCLLQPVLNV